MADTASTLTPLPRKSVFVRAGWRVYGIIRNYKDAEDPIAERITPIVGFHL